jgi:hypothetical protein
LRAPPRASSTACGVRSASRGSSAP